MAPKIYYPIGQQDFRELREDECVYVDKTQYIRTILDSRQRYFFLARPRRFGKSLFLSTLRYFFEGKRDLFKGLSIDSYDREWVSYPVLRLDLNVDKYDEKGMLDKVLDDYFRKWEEEYCVKEVGDTLSIRFRNIIAAAHKKSGKKVVILVDEYDKPLVSNINHDEIYEHYRAKLVSVYSNFKSSAEHIQLVFLTGVSRFSKLSVFSDLNNINDITFDDEYSEICGITEKELHEYFRPGIDDLARQYGVTFNKALSLLKSNYDGYRFTKFGTDIYNPWSVLNCLDKKSISNYWSMTGKPSIIAETIYRFDRSIESLLNSKCDGNTLLGFDLRSASPVAILFQTGYLTIKDYNRYGDIYTLGVPNREVTDSLFMELIPYYVKVKSGGGTAAVVRDILNCINSGEPAQLVRNLDIFFAGIPYEMKMDNENNLHTAIYLLLTLIGANIETEVHTSDGRIDLVLKTPLYIYIIELKFDGSAEEAIAQIEQKQYHLPYVNDQRRLFKIGINFSSKTRRLDTPVIR